MKLHYIQHVPFEGLGAIKLWADSNNIECSRTLQYNGDCLPDIANFDILVVMGGPMSVGDIETYPWLSAEKKFIKDCIDNGKYVIGICLGAQLIAEVLGAEVVPNREKEIGWLPVYSPEKHPPFPFSTLNNSSEIEVFHWHGDTFTLPSGANHLLASVGCQNQAFLYNNKILALQCHFEMMPEGITALIDNCGEELNGEGTYIQTAPQILEKHQDTSRMNQYLHNALTNLIFSGNE